MNDILAKLRAKAPSTALIIGVFVLWELACIAFGISDIVLPRPSQVLATLWDRWPALWPHTYQTLYTTLVGFGWGVLIGVTLGVVIGSSRLAFETAYPLLVGISSIPKVAVVPIFVLWFGAGTVPAVLTAMIICIFPIVVNVATGIATVEPELEALFLRLAEGLDHAGLRRLRRRRDGRLQPRHRQHDDDRLVLLQRAAGLRGAVHPRGARRHALPDLLLHRAPRDGLGASQDGSGRHDLN
jgi:ABC-type phosphate/phosphonate transport system permease subunit